MENLEAVDIRFTLDLKRSFTKLLGVGFEIRVQNQ